MTLKACVLDKRIAQLTSQLCGKMTMLETVLLAAFHSQVH
jgi:hypothetical protein